MSNTTDETVAKPLFVDLTPIIEGQTALETPSVAQVLSGGRCLFYRGRLNELHGEPGEGKTNVLIAASNAVLAAGGSVLFIDPEDTPSGFVRRALGLGGNAEALRTRCFYLHNPTGDEIELAQAWAAEHSPDLVVIDGLAEALAAEGHNEDVAGDVLQFFRERLRPFADKGAAVVVADHVTKSSENRGRWSRGSGAKLGRYDGLVLGVELGKAYTPTQDGYVKLRIQKDRNGGAGARQAILAEVHFEPQDETTKVSFISPEPAENWRPTAIMEKIIGHLETFRQDSKTQVCKAIGSKRAHVLQAITLLLDEGRITCTIKGTSHILSLAAEGAVPPFPTSSQPVPGTGQGVGQPVPECSPPRGGTGTGNDEDKKGALNRKEMTPAVPRTPTPPDRPAEATPRTSTGVTSTKDRWFTVLAKITERHPLKSQWLSQWQEIQLEGDVLKVVVPLNHESLSRTPLAMEHAALIVKLWAELFGQVIEVRLDATGQPLPRRTEEPFDPATFYEDTGTETAMNLFSATLEAETP